VRAEIAQEKFPPKGGEKRRNVLVLCGNVSKSGIAGGRRHFDSRAFSASPCVMFRGSHNIKLDVKGRIMLPVRVREIIQEVSEGEVHVTIHDQDPCLLIYPTPHWLEVEQQILTLPNIHSTANRDLQRFLIGNAREASVDSGARLLIPQPLREYQELNKELVLAGSGKKLELWNQNVWMARFDSWRNAQRNKPHEERDEPIAFSL